MMFYCIYLGFQIIIFKYYCIFCLQIIYLNKVREKANIRNRYNTVPDPTQDNTWEGDKTRKHHTQEGLEVIHTRRLQGLEE